MKKVKNSVLFFFIESWNEKKTQSRTSQFSKFFFSDSINYNQKIYEKHVFKVEILFFYSE